MRVAFLSLPDWNKIVPFKSRLTANIYILSSVLNHAFSSGRFIQNVFALRLSENYLTAVEPSSRNSAIKLFEQFSWKKSISNRIGKHHTSNPFSMIYTNLIVPFYRGTSSCTGGTLRSFFLPFHHSFIYIFSLGFFKIGSTISHADRAPVLMSLLQPFNLISAERFDLTRLEPLSNESEDSQNRRRSMGGEKAENPPRVVVEKRIRWLILYASVFFPAALCESIV